MTVTTNGIFITYPVISVTQHPTTGAPVIDRFMINNVAWHIIAVNGLDQHSEDVTNGGQSTVHFDTKSGMRPIISEASVADILAAVQIAADFHPVSIDVVSVSEDERTKEKKIKRFTGYVDANQIVGVNDLDMNTQQVADDVRSIIYFKPESGLRPTLSSNRAKEIMDKVSEYLG